VGARPAARLPPDRPVRRPRPGRGGRAGRPARPLPRPAGRLAGRVRPGPRPGGGRADRPLPGTGDHRAPGRLLLEEALRLHAAAQQPFGHARTQLLYGEWLRRQRRRTQARPHLRDALEAFGRLGTPAWADRALRELRAAGETAGDHDPGALERLTPQELQIARGVVEGATNREIAAQLFVSPRTVSHHLRSVFSKLGISSRGELIHIGLAGDLEEPGSPPLRP
jgi:DNA-binding CsgD family transcriptional regulator